MHALVGRAWRAAGAVIATRSASRFMLSYCAASELSCTPLRSTADVPCPASVDTAALAEAAAVCYWSSRRRRALIRLMRSPPTPVTAPSPPALPGLLSSPLLPPAPPPPPVPAGLAGTFSGASEGRNATAGSADRIAIDHRRCLHVGLSAPSGAADSSLTALMAPQIVGSSPFDTGACSAGRSPSLLSAVGCLEVDDPSETAIAALSSPSLLSNGVVSTLSRRLASPTSG